MLLYVSINDGLEDENVLPGHTNLLILQIISGFQRMSHICRLVVTFHLPCLCNVHILPVDAGVLANSALCCEVHQLFSLIHIGNSRCFTCLL